jgi:hypothetical protein
MSEELVWRSTEELGANALEGGGLVLDFAWRARLPAWRTLLFSIERTRSVCRPVSDTEES